MEQVLIDRINELSRKSRSEGLTEAELEEQALLRAEYVLAFRRSLEAELDSIVIQRPDGTREKLRKL